MTQKRVLHILASDRFSGAENVVCQIINMYRDDEGVSMAYCSPDGQIRQALEERGIPFYPIKALSVKELSRVKREFKPDIVHAHDMRASFVSALSFGCKKLISHIHNNSFDSRGISAKAILYILAATRASHIFWVSQSAFEGYAFHKLFKKKSTVLYNVIDIDALYEKMRRDESEYDYDIVYVGRLSYPKNPERLMHVLKDTVSKVPDVKIGIIGTGELEDETKALCDTLSLGDNVHFLGFKENPLKILSDAKVMIMTSRWEGTPMVALESMALGTPIVTTPTDGMCELITDGENGYISDSDDVLTDALVRLVTDSETRKVLSENTLSRARQINDIPKYKATLSAYYENR